jgi:GNAT superfamily N-acetyltransferase
VRVAEPRDLDVVVQLRMALLHEHGSHPLFGRLRPDAEARARRLFATQLASAGEVIFLAEDGDRAVGILRCVQSSGSPLLFPDTYGYVSSVYVVPDARRRGVLKAMLGEVETWCRAHGIEELRLYNVASDSGGIAVWDALDFDVVEQLRVRPIGGR